MSKKILNIVTSIKGDASFSNKLSNAVLEKLAKEYPGSEVQTFDLSKTPLPYLNELQLNAFYSPEETHTTVQSDSIKLSDEAIQDLLEADIIVIGEMRDLDTIEAAITLAETGHLVFSTLHTNDTVQTVDRIIQSFPATSQNQIRMQFALSMRMILSQMLLPKADSSGRVAAREIMFNNDSIRNLIIRGETQQLYSVLELSKKDGMILMDECIMNLVNTKQIYSKTALTVMRDPSKLDVDEE